MTLYGIDVSKWQGTVDYAAVKAAGMEYSIARATLGDAYVDPTFRVNRASAAAVGLIPGAYHFLTPGDGRDQADAFLRTIGDGHNLLCALDCESQGLTVANIRRFADRFADRTSDHPLFIYTGIAFWRRLGNPDIDGPLWLAYYKKGGYDGEQSPVWDYSIGGKHPTIWQYGPRVIGTKRIDGDAFLGTADDLRAFTGATSNVPIGDPMPTIVSRIPVIVDLHPGDELLDVTGKHLIDVSVGQQTASPWAETLPSGGTYRLIGVVTGGKDTPCLIHATPTNTHPIPPVDCSGPVAAEHERTRQQAIKAVETI